MKGPCLDPACDCYAETERLKALLSCASDALTYETQKVKAQGQLEQDWRKEAQAEIAHLKALLTRAADALEHVSSLSEEYCGLPSQCHDLIAELRKAAAE